MADTVALLGGAAANQLAQKGLNSKEAEHRAALQKLQDEEEAASWGPFACCIWATKGSTPCCPSKSQFIGWCLLGIAAIAASIQYGKDESDGSLINWGYIACAVIAMVMSLYAMSLFKNIAKLREILDDMRKEEENVKENLEKIRGELGHLVEVHDKLSYLEDEQSVVNAQLRAQRKQFMKWTKITMDINEEGAALIKKIREDMEREILENRRKIERNEKGIMFNALKVFELDDDGKRGLNPKEFELFLDALPRRYKMRWDRSGRNFHDFDKDGNGVIRGSEFRDFLQNIAESEVRALAKGYGIDLPRLNQVAAAPGNEDENESVEEEKGGA